MNITREPIQKLKTELGIELTTLEDNMEVIPKNDWNYQGEGVFIPGNMKAYLLESADQLSLNTIHEHIAHRAYFEKSSHGKELVRKEKKIKSLEKIIFGKQFETIDDFTEILTIQDSNIKDYVIELDKNKLTIKHNLNPLIQEYIGLVHNTRDFENGIRYHAEAFATWLSEFLSPEFGSDKKLLTDEGFLNFKKAEQQFGPLSILKSIGFETPKSNELKLKLLGEHIDIEKAEIVINYGSNNPNSDIDFLIVYKNEPFKINPNHNYLDVIQINYQTLLENIKFKDPQFTIPLVNGIFLKGEEFKKELLRKFDEEIETNDYQDHLNKMKSLAKTYTLESLSRPDKQNLNNALVNISYFRMYDLMSKMNEIIPVNQEYFDTILAQDKIISVARENIKSETNLRTKYELAIQLINNL